MINPKLSFQGSPGRIGCSRDELLSIGATFGPGPHRPTLEALGALPFVKAFGLTWFE
ncbi:MAG: hypothetical protein ACR2PM_14280 [Hyphomicrobiales bacterium]